MLFTNHRKFSLSIKKTKINDKVKASKYLKTFMIYVPEVFDLALVNSTNKK